MLTTVISTSIERVNKVFIFLDFVYQQLFYLTQNRVHHNRPILKPEV
jgi:hypothetical protein